MKIPILSTPAPSVQVSNAQRISQIFLGANAVSSVAYLYFALKMQVWQVWMLVALSLVLVGIGALSAWMSQQRSVAGARLLVVATIVAGLTGSLLVAGIGAMLGIVIMLLSLAIAAQALPRTEINRVLIVGLVAGLGSFAIDVFGAPTRLSIPVLQNLIPYLAGIAGAAFSFLIIRQFYSYSLSTKLLVGVIGLTGLTVATLAFINYRNTQANLINSAGAGLKSVANSQAATITNVLIQEAHVLQSFDLSKIVQDRVDQVNASYGPDQAANLQQIELLDQQWRAADAANNDNAAIVRPILNSEVASELTEFRETFPENVEVFVTDKYGALVAATNRTSDYYQADEDWWQAAYNNGIGAIYFGQPEFDDSSKTFGIILAVPLVAHGTNEVTGVMRTTLNIDSILAILNADILNGTGQIDLYLPGNQVLDPEYAQSLTEADPEASARINTLIGETAYDSFTYEGVKGIVSAAPVVSTDAETQLAIQNLGWVLIVHQDEADALAPVANQTRSNLLIALLILAVAAVMSILLAETITGRIVRLTAVASEIAGGNLAAQADVESPDEVGLLATTFNNMSAQLKNTLDGLEQTVAERTKELEEAQKTMAKRAAELQSVAEISTKASAATNVDELLQNLVELTKSSFNLYHTHVYLVDQSQKKLVLAAGAGDVGKQMVNDKRSIPLDHPHSLVARAARTLQGAISNDVTREPDFLPNPLLPETRAEMAIPIIFGDSILGVLDVQADHVNRFTDEDIAIKTTLAGQIAVSLQNVRSFAEVQARAEREALIGSISQKIQGATTVESVLQITARELGRAVGSKQTRVILKDYASATPTDNKS
jgi:putative methionine-R-sulfoxide reductase with GAF domain